MPAASLITTYLNPPFDRKTGFHNAFKQAMENAGFPNSDVDNYDITDSLLSNSFGGTVFNSGNVGSVRGFVKELTYNASSNGTIGIGGFTRTVQNINLGGSGNTGSPYSDLAFIAGGFVYTGGWNGTTKVPNNASTGRAIGGYSVINDFSSSLAGGDNFVINGNNGILGNSLHSTGSVPLKIRSILNFTNPIKFVAINHPEIRGVYIHQFDKNPYFIGVCKPTNLPAWWNENTFPYAFMAVNSSFFTYRSFHGTFNPYNTAFSDSQVITAPGIGWHLVNTNVTNGQLGIGYSNTAAMVANPFNPANSNRREILAAPHMLNLGSGAGINSGRWLYGQYSGDIIISLSHGLQLFDRIIISAGTEEYTIISTPEYQNAADTNTPMSSRNSPISSNFPYYSVAIRTA